MILQNNFFWIGLFILQILFLNFLALRFHSLLFHITGFTSSRSRFSAKIAGFFLFIGTLVHELSHVLMAALLFVRVKALNIKTETTEDKHIRFGSAEVELVDPVRNSLVGIAPLLFGLVIIYFIAQSINLQNFTWIDILKVLFISQISNTMFLSKSDTTYFKYVIILLSLLLSLILFFNFFFSFFEIRIYINSLTNFMFGNSLVEIMKNVNYIFFLIIILNFLINTFLQTLSNYKRY